MASRSHSLVMLVLCAAGGAGLAPSAFSQAKLLFPGRSSMKPDRYQDRRRGRPEW